MITLKIWIPFGLKWKSNLLFLFLVKYSIFLSFLFRVMRVFIILLVYKLYMKAIRFHQFSYWLIQYLGTRSFNESLVQRCFGTGIPEKAVKSKCFINPFFGIFLFIFLFWFHVRTTLPDLKMKYEIRYDLDNIALCENL